MGNTTPEAITDSAQLFYFLIAAGGATVFAWTIGNKRGPFLSFFAGAIWLLFVYHQWSNFGVDTAHWYMGMLGVVAAIFMFLFPFIEVSDEGPPMEDTGEDEDFDKWQDRRAEQRRSRIRRGDNE